MRRGVLCPPRPELILINKDYLYHFIENFIESFTKYPKPCFSTSLRIGVKFEYEY